MRSREHRLRIGLVLAALLAAARPVRAVQGTEVTVMVKDDSGSIVPGVEIVLTPLGPSEEPLLSAPFKAKTNKKGTATFPFLPWNAQGSGRHSVAMEREGFYIKEYHIESRQLQSTSGAKGTLIQDDQGKPAPKQKLPPLMAKPSGVAEVSLVIASIESYQSAHSAAPSGAGSGEAAPAPVPEEAAKPADPLAKAQLLAAQGKLTEAEEALNALKQSSPTAAVEFELARVYHLQNREADQKTALLAVVAKDPAFPRAHYELGRMAYESGQTAEAITQFEAEVKAYPDRTQAQQGLASLYVETGRPADAIKVYEGMIALDPANTDALVSLDGLYTMQGDQGKSNEMFKKIQALNPTGADAVYYHVGVSISKRSELGEADRKRAAAAFQKAVDLNPKNAKAHRELGYALVGLGKVDEAKTHFESYLQLDPAAKDAATIKAFLQGS